MRIRDFSVSNLGSAKHVDLDNLENLTILVGKNGSGKTFLLSALKLLFEEFAITGGDSVVKSDDYIWHRRDTSDPISINVALELSEQEFRNAAKQLGLTKKQLEAEWKQGSTNLVIVRDLVFRTGWRTASLRIGSIQVVEDDKLSPNLGVDIPEHPNLSRWRLYLFDPNASESNIMGSRLLVDLKGKVAYHSGSELDGLVASHDLQVSLDQRGKDYHQWVSEQGFQLIERTPNPNEAKDLFDALGKPMARSSKPMVDHSFAEMLRSSFEMIPAARDSRESVSFRAPLMDQKDSSEMRALSLSRDLSNESKWGALGSEVEDFLAKRLEPNPDHVLVLDKGLRLPLAQLGAGEQSTVVLEWNLLSGSQIYAIEDPENHLHPDLIGRVYRYLKQRSADTQILVATHSHFLVDKENPSANWMVFIEGQETKVRRCQNNEDLRDILLELGVLPSDIYFRDLIVFVEGGTEKEGVLPIWAAKLNLNLTDNLRVGLLSIGGESRLKDNLRIWLEVAMHAPVEYLVILDSHAASVVAEIHNEMGIPMEKFRILSEHAIEDYYPPRYIVEALKALYDLEIESKDVHKKEGESRAQTIKSILETSRKLEHGWKIAIGSYVAKRMKASEIPEDILDAMERIKALLA